jgi:hypothetical protein
MLTYIGLLSYLTVSMQSPNAKQEQVPHALFDNEIAQLTTGLPNRYHKAVCDVLSMR